MTARINTLSGRQILENAIEEGEYLKKLNLSKSSDHKLDLHLFKIFASACWKCEEIDLSYCSLSDDDMSSIIDSFQGNNFLKKINLTSVKEITKDVISILCKHPSLKEVVFFNNYKVVFPEEDTLLKRCYPFNIINMGWSGY